MALVKRQSANSKTIVIAVVILVVGGLGFFLFKKFYLDVAAGNTPTTNIGTGSVISSFGEELLNESSFLKLNPMTIHPTIDVNKDAGQPQPFQ